MVLRWAGVAILIAAAGYVIWAQIPASSLSLDHVVVAVNDLEASAEKFRKLGFMLKPGRFHENGIRNWHAKFPDGTEIELLTAPEARDDLTRKYRDLLAEGDGGAFLALFPGAGVPAPTAPVPDYIFYGQLNHSPTDKPEYFAHGNTAESLIAVWVGDVELAKAINTNQKHQSKKAVPNNQGSWPADVIPLRDSEIYLLPRERRVLRNRPIVGVSVRVNNIRAASEYLARHGIKVGSAKGHSEERIFVAPADACGIWLEFRKVSNEVAADLREIL